MKKLAFCIMAMAMGLSALAQETLNPAATPDYGFIRIGELNNATRNNVGAASFIFPSGDKLVTGLHSSISADQFLGGLKPVNSLYSDLNYNLVTYGWKGRTAGFHTVYVGARANYGLSVPKEIFQLMKTGTAQSPYDLSSLKAFGNVYGEIAYGYSLPLGDNLSLGARVKLLVGFNSADVAVRRMNLTTTEDQYNLDLDADIDLTNRSKKIGVDDNGYLDYTSFTGKGKLGLPTGAGLAADFGVVWKPFDGFTLSASALDLGGILWYYGNAGTSNGTFTFEGLKDLSTDEMDEESLNAKLKETADELLAVVKPKAAEGRFKLKALPLSANLKASYALPFFDMLSVDVAGRYTGYSFCAPYWETRGGLSFDYTAGLCHLSLSAGSGTCGFVYGIDGFVDFLSFRLYASFENGVGGVIPYESTPLKANNKVLSLGLIYKL